MTTDAQATLSTADHRTLEAIYRHPVAANLGWHDVAELFEHVGSLERRHDGAFVVGLAGHQLTMRRPHGKDLTAAEVVELRHFVSRSGRMPDAPETPPIVGDVDLLVAVEHHEARIYVVDVSATDAAAHVIRPHDPHNHLHHLTHRDRSRERGQRAHEDPSFYERVAQAVRDARRIVLVGHGHGHSDAAHHLNAYLAAHHPETAARVRPLISADLSSVTQPQLLALARDALGETARTIRQGDQSNEIPERQPV